MSTCIICNQITTNRLPIREPVPIQKLQKRM